MSKKEKKEKEVDKSCEKCDEYITGWKRALADYDNLKKDLLREKNEIRAFVKEDTVQDILPVLDNFDQAVKFEPEGLDGNAKAWLSGIMHVKNQLEDVLSGLGAVPYGSVGDKFDPNLHDASGEKQDKKQDDQVILEIITRGWKIQDRIVRPAKVIVNKK